MKKNRKRENRMIAAILGVAIVFSQVNIADAADLQISDSNTTQEQVSHEEDTDYGEDKGNVDMESAPSPSEEEIKEPDNTEAEAPDTNVETESTEESETDEVETSEEGTETESTEENTETESAETESTETESTEEDTKAETTENIDIYYKNDRICIYNYDQLKQIGSDAYVYTGDKDGEIGSGEVVKNEDTELKYGADARYSLMNDIQMNSEQIWSVPDSFTGTITGTEVEENETPTLYDKKQIQSTYTIHIS